jgi:iron complex outermembrane recepter protein
MTTLRKYIFASATSVIAFSIATPVQAQSAPASINTPTPAADPEAPASDIIVTGTRGQPRTVASSPVPVDVIGQKELQSISYTDTVNILQTAIPSLNVQRQPNSTTGSFIRPITLRGLPEDKTLLLVNSKRRHKTASVAISGTGAQGEDSAVIPALALKSIEVLRDGAAAQYGSDAIAGVINFILNDSNHGTHFTAQTGQYYAGDGTSVSLAANTGMKLTDRGFVNLTAEYTHDDRTTRAKQYTSTTFDATAYAATHPQYASLINLAKPLQRWGQPLSHAVRTFINSGYDLTDNTKLYAFGNWSHSRSTADANYRYPGNGQAVEDVAVRLADGSTFKFNQLYPAGFKPLFTGHVTDWSAVGGYKGTLPVLGNDFGFDLSGRYGWNKIVYTMVNSLNPSMGPSSPTSFTPNSYVNRELAANADFTYTVNTPIFASPLALSAGGEYRHEKYTIRPGDENSYKNGIYSSANPYHFCNSTTHTLNPGAPTNQGINCANYLAGTADGFAGIDPVYNTLSAGSQGFTGTAPTFAGTFGVISKSAYLEASTDILKGWFMDLAGRYENYNSFGSTWNGKAATRIELTHNLAIRGSIGTGFHAPSPALLNQSYTSIRTVSGVFTLAGLVPASNPVATFLGAKPLKPEKSTNFSAGITAQPLPGLNLTIDGYLIKIRDQIYSTSQITVTSAIQAQLVAANIVGATSIASVNFFQNAFNSTTKGLDIVATYRQRWSDSQSTDFMVSTNINRYHIDKLLIGNLFNQVSINNFQKGQPAFRMVASATHNIGPFSVLLRANIYGPYTAQLDSAAAGNPIQKFHSEALIDMEGSYKINSHYTIAVGMRNMLNNYPQKDKIGAVSGGALYRTDSVVDWQGGFYYGRVSLNF